MADGSGVHGTVPGSAPDPSEVLAGGRAAAPSSPEEDPPPMSGTGAAAKTCSSC